MQTRSLGIALFCIFLQSVALADIIKKKNGQVVVGEIKGRIVLRGPVADRKGGKNRRSFTFYSVIRNEHITSIDENGVHSGANGGYLLVSASHPTHAPTDVIVFQALSSSILAAEGFSVLPLPEGGTLVMVPLRLRSSKELPATLAVDLGKFEQSDALRIIKDFQGAESAEIAKIVLDDAAALTEKHKNSHDDGLNLTGALMGELRFEGGKGQVLPRIEVVTSNGATMIPVDQIIAFRGGRKRVP